MVVDVKCIKGLFGVFWSGHSYKMENPYYGNEVCPDDSKPYSISYDYVPDDLYHVVNMDEDMLFEYFDGEIINRLKRAKKLKKIDNA